MKVHRGIARVSRLKLVRVLEKKCSSRGIPGFEPDGSAEIAHKEGIDVGPPNSQQVKRSIPLPSFSCLVRLIKPSLSLARHLQSNRRLFVEGIEILSDPARSSTLSLGQRLP